MLKSFITNENWVQNHLFDPAHLCKQEGSQQKNSFQYPPTHCLLAIVNLMCCFFISCNALGIEEKNITFLGYKQVLHVIICQTNLVIFISWTVLFFMRLKLLLSSQKHQHVESVQTQCKPAAMYLAVQKAKWLQLVEIP